MTKARNLSKLASVNTSIVGNTVYISGNVSLANATLSLGANTINSTSLTSTGVVANSYGNTTAIPVITVDAAGRITNATTSSVSGVTGLSYTAANSTVTVSTSTTNFDAVVTSGNSSVQGLLRVVDSVSNTSTSIAAAANSVTTAYLLAANAVSNATAYAATAYSNAVATAASDATTKAGTAYSNATTYAATIAGTAYSNAVSVAASDATTKAGTAYSNAVSVASSDATTKAGTAYSNAIAYANTVAYTAAGTAYSNVFNGGTFSGAVTVQANLTANSVRMNGNLQVDGDLTVSGNTVTINVTNLNVEDNMIYLNSNSVVSHPDLGFAGNYNDGSYKHAGLFRDATDGVWKFFHGYTPEPDASAFIDTANTSFALSNLQINYVIGNVTGSANSATYLGGNTASTLRSYSDTMAGTAYSNATAYAATIAGTAYSNAVSVASSDATTKAGTAYSNATTFATTIAGTAYSNAVSVASSDATTKAGTAYSNAVSVASSDATTKAGTAYSNATAFAANASNISSGTLSASRLPATYLTSVTGTAPVVSSGGATPVISMAAANSTVAGYMTTIYATKLDGIATGATNVTNNNQLTNGAGYVTSSGVTAVTATGPVVSSGGTTPVISMAAATASVDGYMTTAFASKLNGIAAGATNVTNNNQLTNGAGYITGYTETDTLATVTGRGSSTTGAITISSGTTDQGLTMTVSDAGWNYIGFNHGVTRKAYFGLDGSGNPQWGSDSGTLSITGNYTTIGTSTRSPLFYDSDNTGFYADPASQSVFNRLKTYGGDSGTPTQIIQAAVYPMIDWYSDSADANNRNWRFASVYNSYGHFQILSGTTTGGTPTTVRLTLSGLTGNLYVGDGVTASYRLHVVGTGYATSDFRAPVFYDSNDTTYYVDPASTDSAKFGGYMGLGGNGYTSNMSGTFGISIRHAANPAVGFSSNVAPDHLIYKNGATLDVWSSSVSTICQFVSGPYTYMLGSARSPIFYDSDNTGYYTDQASTSNVNQINMQGFLRRNASAAGYMEGNYPTSTDGNSSSAIYTIGGSYQPANTTLGNMYGVGYTVGSGTASPGLGQTGWGFYVASGGTSRIFLDSDNGVGIATQSFRSSIFYDSNDTGYYINPNGTSSMNRISSVRTDYWLYIDANYGHSVVGVYSSYLFQGVFAMGDSYKLTAGGGVGNLYGMCWSHPNAGGAAGNLDSHGLIVLINGGFGSCMSYSIKASGNVTAYSDERLKTNWRDMPEDFVARLAKVKVGIYDRIDGEKLAQVGVSAQSLQTLLPQAVTEANDDIKTLSVSYGNAAMASAVELAKEVVLLKQTISSQEERIAKLEALVNNLLMR